jgi:proline iminopeptidase
MGRMSALAPGRHDASINGARIAYHVYGEGPVIVAFPGGPGFSHAYMRMPQLETRAKLVYVDPIGTGNSDQLDPSQYGRARDVEDLEELRKHLGLERITILGHSAGGFVAQQYALEHPDRVERLILSDTSATNGPEFDASLKREMAARAHYPWFPSAAGALQTLFTREVSEEEARELGAKIWPLYAFDHESNPTLAEKLSNKTPSLPRMQKAPRSTFDFREQLGKLRVPTLVIVGARDFICSPELAGMLHRAIPDAKLVVMEKSGHMPHIEEPRAFADAVASFL